MSALAKLLTTFRNAAVSEREKGTYFEELIVCYLRNEATYADLYSSVWTYADWAKEQGLDARDTGIDLVAQTQGTGEYHAIQCKFYAEDHRVTKSDIDSFFTASGKKPFTHRVIVTTTNNWSEHANDALQNQQPPVSKIDFHDLENSQIDWEKYQPKHAPEIKAKKTLRPHQISALEATESGLANAERGKLIMACGTGKTFTSLKISEKLAGAGKRVLFLVPSLSLLSQTLTEWTQESTTPLHSFAVCSDGDVGKKRKKDDDVVQTFAHELRYPATTNPARLAEEMTKRHDAHHMSVVFSTYHSIDVISKAQKEFSLADFDLIICDEAHRTTGATFGDDDESNFVKVHDADFIKSAKRLYMTATPRIYGENAKAKADSDDVALCSMDDEALYGKELYVINFSEAVRRELLVDYKVLVLAVSQDHVSERMQELLRQDDNQLKVDDAAKIIGCWKGLSKQDTQEDLVDDNEPMRRAVAFCQVIENTGKSKTHKVSSVNIAGMFSKVVEAYKEQEFGEDLPSVTLQCEAEHVDGGMNASQKEEKLSWLKEETPENTCRILSNVRCLSEGVDVPALDAVLFLTPRNSQVDVVQSVGRVMRRAEGKKRGYVILPVVIPSGMEAHEALDDNVTYKVVWQVLQALRSHDDRFDAMINKLEFSNGDKSKMEVIAISDKIQKKATKGKTGKASNQDAGKGNYSIGEAVKRPSKDDQAELQFHIGEIERAIYAKVVQKCGNRHHWADWANDIAKIARTHISRITAIIADEGNTVEREAFFAFVKELKDDLNDSITDAEVIEMLAQHLITKPVFDALFSDYSFASHNPMSCAMQNVLDILQEHRLDKEADTLERFYASVKMRAEGIDNAEGKQKIIVELYDKFFRNAFPRMTERLGIVYTPVEVVDFIIHSIDHILKTEFDQSLGSDGVHIIDPFTGTGTFITRLLQSGLISKEQLQAKYKGQIHANEIVLLAYYIAAINIEAVYHSIVGGDYVPFEGICLTDTFQMYEKEDLVDQLLEHNSARRKKQKALDIRVIMGNPPYSVGQDSGNDNNQNIAYPHLDERIRVTYAARTTATNKNALYDSYIRSIRWASDRIGDCGIMGFVTNAGFVDSRSSEGLRKALSDEFSDIYVFHLRGLRGQKTAGERAKKEGGQIFGMGSAAAIAITLLVKNPQASEYGNIYFHDIGDYLSREQKLERISSLRSVAGITANDAWARIIPDEHGDWLNQRDDSFAEFIVLGDKGKKSSAVMLFENFSRGLETGRDAWCFNSSVTELENNLRKMIGVYNTDRNRIHGVQKSASSQIDDKIESDPKKISWTASLKQHLVRNSDICFNRKKITASLYRPFFKQNVYYCNQLIHRTGQMTRFYPPEICADNLVICVSGCGDKVAFSSLISNIPPSLHMVDIDGSQCFPFYLYEPNADNMEKENTHQGDMLAGIDDSGIEENTQGYTRKDAITDEGLAHFHAAYPNQIITKEDVFYYVYGLLHSPDYRERYADNLSKELPRIPCVKTYADFQIFSQAGRDLAELHLNYETIEMYPASIVGGGLLLSDSDYRVEKMKYGKKGKEKDLTTLIYNDKITVTGIPLDAYEYVVNGKPAIDWVVERQCVSTHKDSGIINDANDWAIETMQNPKYPLELFLRVVTVSLETMKIVKALPALQIG
ncbi:MULTISPECIES: DEAD/DEAH box helicase [Deefgea]|uniref:DEAD/DEAH box helicase n=1 Tax=Deefgea chitinilytica TaxID=570276 RepID=A0ABS2C996_9NEIS|nr:MULTISPECIES: type ISP restriction/modification enzyme [Deefgea]MBM5570729.1 DEAD/DEAH box helicase [Deefgea chitinilytica]MBM9887958.1 DEAD/DEAH box helicase [Deefgea sp. CFH1-16]